MKSVALPSTLRGSSLVESLVAFPLLLLIGLGVVQWALIYEAKSTLNYATFMAARAGAVDHAKPETIKEVLARSLVALYSPDKSAKGLAEALVKTNTDVNLFSKIRILNPTEEAFADFETTEKPNVLPNYRLWQADTTPGPTSHVNIQDANLLKLEVTYQYPLKVPYVGRIIAALVGVGGDTTADDGWKINSKGHSAQWKVLETAKSQGRIPILASATVRMQSTAHKNPLMISLGNAKDGNYNQLNLAGPIDSQSIPAPLNVPTSAMGNGTDSGTGTSPIAINTPINIPDRPDVSSVNPASIEDGNNLPDEGAGDPNNCGDSLDGKSASQKTALPGRGIANPINVITGNKYQQEVDFGSLPGELGLGFVRHYNSRNRQDGKAGFGWRHNYMAELTPPANQTDTIRLTQGDGRKLIFHNNDRNQYKAQLPSDGTLQVIRQEYHWHWHNGRILIFNKKGQLTRIKSSSGVKVSLLYDANKLWRVIDPQGRILSLSYYKHGRIKNIVDPEQGTIRYHYDSAGNAVKVTYPDDTTRQYHYEDPNDKHNLTGLTDERGIRLATWDYDEKDRAILSTHADGVNKVTLDFSTEGQTKVTDSQGKRSIYYTEIRNGTPLVTRIDGPGCSSCGIGDVQYSYNANNQLSARTTKNGITTHYAYDDLGRKIGISRQFSGQNPQWQVLYQYQGNSHKRSRIIKPSIKPDAIQLTHLTYNDNQLLTQINEQGYAPTSNNSYTPIKRRTKLSYDGFRLIAIDGPREDIEDIIRLSYDTHTFTHDSRLQAITLPDGTTQKVLAYDKQGRPSKIQSGEQTPIEISYNRKGQPEAIKREQRTISYIYTATGKLKSITDPDGNTTTLTYDTADRTSKVTDADGHVLNVELDTEDRLVQNSVNSQNGTLLRTISYLYDAEGRLNHVNDADGKAISQYDYDEQGRPIRKTDAQGNTSEMSYGSLGQLLSLTQPGDVVTQYNYDENNQYTGLTDGRNNTTEYRRDDFGNTLFINSPDTGLTQYTYDAAGNLLEKIDAEGRSSTYLYNASNRIIERSTDDEVVNLHYKSGQLVKMQGSDSSETFAYDTDGKLIQHTRHIDGHTFTTAYIYDAITARLKEKHLPDQQVLNYHYHSNGKLQAITRNDFIGRTTIVGELNTEADSLTHKQYVFGNAIATSHDYDNNGQLIRLSTSRVQQLNYHYNEQGNISGIERNTGTEHYAYDTLSRLTQAKTSVGSFEYRYDKLGNRTSKTRNGQETAYRYSLEGQGNRLDEISSEIKNSGVNTLNYNVTGSPVQSGNKTYQYNAEQRPVKLLIDGKLKAEYGYNGWGERIKKTVYSGNQKKVTYYFYEDQTLIGEAEQDGKISAQYVYYKGQAIAKLEDKNLYAIHTNHLGTPQAVTDDDGELVWKAVYTPFGKATVTTEKIVLNLRFPGQYEDAESGMHYNYFRDYDPEMGRYLTSDPIGLKGGLNTYAYVDGNPLLGTDYLGLIKREFGELDDAIFYIWNQINKNMVSTEMEKMKYHTAARDLIPAFIEFNKAVKADGPWDHKQVIQLGELNPGQIRDPERYKINEDGEEPKNATNFVFEEFDEENQICYRELYYYDIFSNIHYGFIGLEAGFSEDNLLDAAGLAQTGKPLQTLFTDPTGDWSLLDDPRDQVAIKIGMQLYREEDYMPDRIEELIRENYHDLRYFEPKAPETPEPSPVNTSLEPDGA